MTSTLPRRSQRLASILHNKEVASEALGIPDTQSGPRLQFHMIHAIFLASMIVSVGLVVYCFSLIPAEWGGRNLFLGIIGLLAGVALVVDNLVLVSGFCKS